MTRAIDTHEPAIVQVLNAVDDDGAAMFDACISVARTYGTPSYPMTPARLHYLVQSWCAVAGLGDHYGF